MFTQIHQGPILVESHVFHAPVNKTAAWLDIKAHHIAWYIGYFFSISVADNGDFRTVFLLS